MSRTVRGRVIGVGSPFGADRAGWEFIHYLQASGFPERFPELEWQTLNRPGPRLIERLVGMEFVVIIDALLGGSPGQPRRVDAVDLAKSEAGFSSHGFGVAEALAMAEALGDLPERLAILGIGVGDGQCETRCDYSAVAVHLEKLLADHGFSVA